MAGWKSRLQPASFRGVPFSVESDEGTFGRRVQTHEYPNRDKPYTEDLGRATRRFTISAYLIGDDYIDQRDRLIAAVDTPGPGTLVHPNYGEMAICVDGEVRVSHSNNEGRMCRISFSFVEAGELSFPTSGVATGQVLVSSCSALDDSIGDAFSSFGLGGLSDFIQSDVLDQATAMINTVADAFTMVDEGIAAAARLLQGDLSVLLMPPSSGMNFVNALQKMWRAGNRLTGDASDLVTLIDTLSGVTLGHDLAPRGVWNTDSTTTQVVKSQQNYVAEAIRTTAISEAAYTVTLLPQPKTPVNQRSPESATPVVSHPALNDAGMDNSVPAPVTWDDLIAVRAGLNHVIDTELQRTADDGLFLSLNRVRTDTNRDISTRLAQVEKTVTRTPPDVLPALVLAATWYDNAAREIDITGRNAVKHPGFIPVQPLRVPVR
ncbi:DNA circularization protein [Serratia marcescens]|uniref:DNA circularization protein n=1 Tax=Serratia marcescens TaxID=615 RepID=UPI0007453F98|nr:DNA circularization N-terminal domain-containing protein [Serratia marcescens]MDX7487042.1 DNA circularization N-terminal domain-containing protein [Serratia marcescens]WLS21676.1 DNA circularization N-terminal domain-containing protein [Serratia marcescens]CAI1601990.1 Mu-like prophage DNA circulation protein [Serratia marcescens]CUY96666.1 Mu-like prophage DNA circulation protein [Serratia marcescens]HCB1485473.1 DNA circularization N-terminal domain-containing protein [Serratia marcescen